MKSVAVQLIIAAVIMAGIQFQQQISASYSFSRDIESSWSLADKASTIQQKSEYMNKFVKSLENQDLEGEHDAVIFKTPDNSFDANFGAIKSLQSRLQQIQTMDVRSFEYQTAIQQITAQEQGEAGHIIGVIHSIWEKVHYPIVWQWWGGLFTFAWLAVGFIGIGTFGIGTFQTSSRYR